MICRYGRLAGNVGLVRHPEQDRAEPVLELLSETVANCTFGKKNRPVSCTAACALPVIDDPTVNSFERRSLKRFCELLKNIKLRFRWFYFQTISKKYFFTTFDSFHGINFKLNYLNYLNLNQLKFKLT